MNNWYCIYTKPNQEDIISFKLLEHPGIELFSPKITVHTRLRNKPATQMRELFPCYVFSRFEDPRYFQMIRYTRGVKRFVGDSAGFPYVVDDRIIDTIRTRMKDGLVHLDPPGFMSGERVVITGGAFDGLHGVFLHETKPHERVVILLGLIQDGARVVLPREQIARG
jgi:transcriptional antiterminator RfaH